MSSHSLERSSILSSYRGMLRSVREGVFFWKTDFDYDISIQSQLLILAYCGRT